MDSNCNPYQVPSTGETGGDENGNVNSDTGNSGQLFLGFDLSTQQLKAVAVNKRLTIVHEASVHFDSDLPEFRTHGGVHRVEGSKVVTAPVLMWVKALDMVLDRLKLTGMDFGNVSAICGSGQQHGSVYWKKGSLTTLQSLEPSAFLHKQLESSFSLRESPIWMDSSTASQCAELENCSGGPEALAAITGSRAYERFTGSQILKVVQTRQDVYQMTERVSLVSSFLASLFIGSYAPIDFSDGSGMNLLNIRTHEWDQSLTNFIAHDLCDKLGQVVLTGSKIGFISKYFSERYGFPENCNILSFTGDNPASLVGMCLRDGDIAVSLGTSDTVFLSLKSPKPDVNGHILCNPLSIDSYMALLCYKNGSQTRERIRDECSDGDWTLFSELLESTPRGNFGNIGFYFDMQEIYPLVSGDYRFNKLDQKVYRFSKEVEVRACIEGQFLRLLAHSQDLGYSIGSDTRVLATGGASTNKAILQVLADVFNAPVFVQEKPNSAAAGAAFLARFHGLSESEIEDFMQTAGSYNLAASPAKDAHTIYTPLIERYRKLEKIIQGK